MSRITNKRKLNKVKYKTQNRIPQVHRNKYKEYKNYLIIFDTEKTEKYYLTGLKNSLEKERKIHIEIMSKPDKHGMYLIDEAIKENAKRGNRSEVWCVFDKDRLSRFDEIIAKAERNNIKPGWSNPCIEVWFGAYFDFSLKYTSSVSCCNDFSFQFSTATGRKYKKNDENIYELLTKYGNEKRAVEKAENWETTNKGKTFAESVPGTSLHRLMKFLKPSPPQIQ
jgi:hypothetical protein